MCPFSGECSFLLHLFSYTLEYLINFNSPCIIIITITLSVSGQLRSLSQSKFSSKQSSVSSFSFQYLLVCLRSSSSCLRLLPRLPIPSMFPSITYFRKDVRSGMSVDIPTMMVGNKFIYNFNWMISWENITQVTEIQNHEISRSADYVNYHLLYHVVS